VAGARQRWVEATTSAVVTSIVSIVISTAIITVICHVPAHLTGIEITFLLYNDITPALPRHQLTSRLQAICFLVIMEQTLNNNFIREVLSDGRVKNGE